MESISPRWVGACGFLLILCISTGAARGEQSFSQEQCDTLWQQAEEAADQERHREAAELFVRLYTTYIVDCPTFDGHGADEVLARAASLYDEDERNGPAIQIRQRLLSDFGATSDYAKSHPGGSPHATRALYDMARSYEHIFAFTKAATCYEEFSSLALSPAQPLAPSSLRRAITLRIALGQGEKARENAAAFISRYGRERAYREAVGQITIDLSELAKSEGRWDVAEEHLRRYLERPAKMRRAEHDIIVHSLRGLSLWKQGADHRRKALESFSRAVVGADRNLKQDCSHSIRLDYYRTKITSSRAAPALETEEVDLRLQRLVYAVGRARFYVAEAERIQFEALGMPSLKIKTTLSPKIRQWWSQHIGLDKARAWEKGRSKIASIQYQHWLERSYVPWLDRKNKVRENVEELYVAAIGEGASEWEVAAAYRIGGLYESVRSSLIEAPVDPSFSSDQELVDLYRDALDSAAAGYIDGAIQSYLYCRETASRRKVSNEWSRGCERRLNAQDRRNDPQGDPLLSDPDLHDNGFALPLEPLGM